MQKFCVCWFAIHVCCIGTKLAVQAWNEHTTPSIPIWILQHVSSIILYHIGPRRGCASCDTPSHQMASNNHMARIDPQLILSPEDAVSKLNVTSLTSVYLVKTPLLVMPLNVKPSFTRDTYPTLTPFFHKVVNGDDCVYYDCLLFLIQITQALI